MCLVVDIGGGVLESLVFVCVCESLMNCGGEEEKQWSCGKAGSVNFRKVSSIVRDIGDPCLSQSPVKVVVTVR